MEMRRRASSRPERLLLTLYWLVSGYGLRASRALLSLIVLIVGSSALAVYLGFMGQGVPFSDALTFGLRSALSLQPSSQDLTTVGEALQILLRLLGPVLLGLALLSLRGRLKS
jgi:hypothetical protein